MGHEWVLYKSIGGRAMYVCRKCNGYTNIPDSPEIKSWKCKEKWINATLDDYCTDCKDDEAGDQGDYEPL